MIIFSATNLNNTPHGHHRHLFRAGEGCLLSLCAHSLCLCLCLFQRTRPPKMHPRRQRKTECHPAGIKPCRWTSPAWLSVMLCRQTSPTWPPRSRLTPRDNNKAWPVIVKDFGPIDSFLLSSTICDSEQRPWSGEKQSWKMQKKI